MPDQTQRNQVPSLWLRYQVCLGVVAGSTSLFTSTLNRATMDSQLQEKLAARKAERLAERQAEKDAKPKYKYIPPAKPEVAPAPKVPAKRGRSKVVNVVGS